MQANPKALAYALLRIAIGVNFAGHGLIRFHIGVSQFASGTTEHLSKSPLPHGLILAFLYMVPFVEALVGLALIFGLGTRFALVISSVLMICLTIGVTSNQQFETAGTQLLYSFVLFALLFLVEYNELSLDRVFRR